MSGGLYGGIRFGAPSSASFLPAQPRPAPVGPETGTEPIAVEPEEPVASSKPTAWSAALAFQPVRRTVPSKKTNVARLPVGASLASATVQANFISNTAVISAPPATIVEAEAPNPGGWGKKVKPPSMILDEDVNGFKANHNRKRGKGKKNKYTAVVVVWDPAEQYDLSRPNDYTEYKVWKAKDRIERQRATIERKRGRESPGYSDSEGSRSEEERPRKTGRYEERDEEPRARGIGSGFGSSSALNAGAPSFAPSTSGPSCTTGTPMMVDPSGDEAFQRRAALSAGAMRPPPSFMSSSSTMMPPPPIQPTSSGSTYAMHVVETTQARFNELVPPAPSAPIQPPSPPSTNFNWFGPRPGGPAPPSGPPPPMMTEQQTKAAAIAAKLSAYAKAAAANAPPPPPPELKPRDNKPFAERFMKGLGYEEGKGLGQNSDGIVNALTVDQVTQKGGGKKAKKAQVAQKIIPSNGGIGIGKGTAKIINDNVDAHAQADIVKFGESSRVIVLSNMVGPADVDDENLPDEIGGECAKNGTVERVVVHLVYPPVHGDDAVRVFVKFAGPVAAWKTIRELDGRFFGGRTVVARYFPEKLWDQHVLDDTLMPHRAR